jgi:hypothetical protein
MGKGARDGWHDLVAQLVLECLIIDLPVRKQVEKTLCGRSIPCCPGFFPGACRNLDRNVIFHHSRHRAVLVHYVPYCIRNRFLLLKHYADCFSHTSVNFADNRVDELEIAGYPGTGPGRLPGAISRLPVSFAFLI